MQVFYSKMITLAMLFCPLIQAQTGHRIFYLHYQQKRVAIAFEIHDGVLINDICQEKIDRCRAYAIYKDGPPSKKRKLKMGILLHRAAAYCKHRGGVPMTLLNNRQEGRSFCAFSDKSIISSWNLYRHHFEGKK